MKHIITFNEFINESIDTEFLDENNGGFNYTDWFDYLFDDIDLDPNDAGGKFFKAVGDLLRNKSFKKELHIVPGEDEQFEYADAYDDDAADWVDDLSNALRNKDKNFNIKKVKKLEFKDDDMLFKADIYNITHKATGIKFIWVNNINQGDYTAFSDYILIAPEHIGEFK